jgi:microcystin-dependent protein
VSSLAQLTRAIGEIGLPGVLKTRRLGYDGKGQAVVRTAADAPRAWQQLGRAALIYDAPGNLTSLQPGTIAKTGGSQAHENMQPFLTLSFCIALQGIFPSPN